MRLATGLRHPRNPVPGRDVAGIVAEVGRAVTKFTVGDEVYGIAPGSFAEYAAARETQLARKPASLSFAEAAVVPVSAGTALRALVDVGHVQPDQSVLVLGASGGVGSYAVQLAKAFGAEVTGVCSTTKTDLVTSLGADHVIDYTRDDFADGSRTYDLVLDIAGNPSLRQLRRALEPRGTAVFVGGEDSGVITGMGRQLRGALISPPEAAPRPPRCQGAGQRLRTAHRAHRDGSDHSEPRPHLPARRGATPCGSSRQGRSAARSPSPRADEHHRQGRRCR